MAETGQEDAIGTGKRALRAVKVLVGSNLETVSGETVARTARDEDAAAIVRMVNAHARLVDALTEAHAALGIGSNTLGLYVQISAALRAARGEG